MSATVFANRSANVLLSTNTTRTTPSRRTEAQRAASRHNGAKSSGPITPEGKIASRRNALKDGLSPEAVTVLPAEMQREVDTLLDAFVREYQPRGPQELGLVQTAALAGVRLHRLMSAEHRHAQNRVRRSVLDWDTQRAELVDLLAELLMSDPRAALRQLRTIAEGCDYLADVWDALADSLQNGGNWSQEERRLALRLLGSLDAPDATIPPRQSPQSAAAALLERLKAIDSGAADAAALLAFAQSQRDSLIQRGNDLWEKIDGPDRAEAPLRAPFDPSPEYARLARYMVNAERVRQRALAELQQIRADRASLAQARRESLLDRMAAYQHARTEAQSTASTPVEKPTQEPAAPPRQNEPSATQPPAASPTCEPSPAQVKTSSAFSHSQPSKSEPRAPRGPDASR